MYHPKMSWLCLLLLLSLVCSVTCFQTAPGQQQHSHRRSFLSAEPLRLNKAFKATHSRRAADRIIQEGRVAVNGETSYGCMVVPFQDKVTLDGTLVQGWEQMNGIASSSAVVVEESSSSSKEARSDHRFEYVKYWKPRGVICTTDRRIDGNIIDEIMQYGGYQPRHRVYPVGRLDKDSSGLILLTSDGRLPNASLRQNQKQPKVYRVRVDLALNENDLERLRSGIVITTVAQRDGKAKPLTAKTKPCLVQLLSPNRCEITLTEGRNRQIRKMMAALGYTVRGLHRTRFGEISLDDVSDEGEWKRLDQEEMQWVESILEGADLD